MESEETSTSPLTLSSPRDIPVRKKIHVSHVGDNNKRELPRVENKTGKHTNLNYRMQTDGRGNCHHVHDSNVVSAKHLERTKHAEKRKEVARRNLLGSIYTKQNSVKRSFSFVAGERPKPDLRLPGVSQTSPDYRPNSYPNKNHKDSLREQIKMDTQDETIRIKTVKTTHTGHRAIPRQKSSETKLTLPDIVLDFNLENTLTANGLGHDMAGVSDSDGEAELTLGASYEKIFSKPKVNVSHNPYRAKYRPITPGLLKSLNALRVPANVKTEQWINSVQDTRKSYQCGSSYQAGNLDNANLAFPNWIYTDT